MQLVLSRHHHQQQSVACSGPARRSVAHVRVTVAYYVQHLEGDGEQPGAEQVAHGRQVRDGEVVRVLPFLPQVVNQPVREVQKQGNLQTMLNVGNASQRLKVKAERACNLRRQTQ